MDKVEITAKDEICPSYVFRPQGSGPWPGVLVFIDGVGIRPAIFEVGERIAAHGYLPSCRTSSIERARTTR
jgi:carboxymethylenebutenolidase